MLDKQYAVSQCTVQFVECSKPVKSSVLQERDKREREREREYVASAMTRSIYSPYTWKT